MTVQLKWLRWPTWYLWKHLTYHPRLALPVLTGYTAASEKLSLWSKVAVLLPPLLLLVGSYYLLRNIWRFMLEGIFLILMLPVPLSLLLFYGSLLPELHLIIRTASQVHQDRISGRVDLLMLQPSGLAAWYWANTVYSHRFSRISGLSWRMMSRLGKGCRWMIASVLLPAALVMFILYHRGPGIYLVPQSRVASELSFMIYQSFPYYLVLILVIALLILLLFVWMLQSSVTAILLSVIVPSVLVTVRRNLSRWVLLLSFPLYHAVFLLAPLLLLSILLAGQVRDIATYSYDWTRYAVMMNAVAVLLSVSTIGRELVVIALWRMAIRLFGDDLLVLRVD